MLCFRAGFVCSISHTSMQYWRFQNRQSKLSLNKQTNVLTWTVTYSGLSGPAIAGHFHGPAIAGANAGVALPLMGDLTSPIKGSATHCGAVSGFDGGDVVHELAYGGQPEWRNPRSACVAPLILVSIPVRFKICEIGKPCRDDLPSSAWPHT